VFLPPTPPDPPHVDAERVPKTLGDSHCALDSFPRVLHSLSSTQ
jgi:hypothetical protein